MTVEQGLGMLLMGMVAILIGGLCAYYVINHNQGDDDDNTKR